MVGGKNREVEYEVCATRVQRRLAKRGVKKRMRDTVAPVLDASHCFLDVC